MVLHQANYTEMFLEEHGSSIPNRGRWTTGEAKHFSKEQPQPPDQANPEHLEWIKKGQRIIGALLWLSTRTRPDLACGVSLASQVLFKDISSLKTRLKHILQYLKTIVTRGLLYLFPQRSSSKTGLTEFTIYSDSSFALLGQESQTGLSIHLSYGTVCHVIHFVFFYGPDQFCRKLNVLAALGPSVSLELIALLWSDIGWGSCSLSVKPGLRQVANLSFPSG